MLRDRCGIVQRYFKCFRQVATASNNFGIFVLSNSKLNSASWRRSDIEVALLNKLSTGSYRTGTGRRGSARVMRPMQCDRHPFVCSGKRAANIARHGLRLRSLRRTPGAMFAMTRNTDTVHAGCDADQAGVSPRTGQPTVYMQTCAHPRCNVSGASCSHQGQIGISPPPQSADAGASDTSSLIMPATVASREFSPTHLLPTSTTDNGLGGQQRNR